MSKLTPNSSGSSASSTAKSSAAAGPAPVNPPATPQMQVPGPSQALQDKMDYISKVKTLMPSLRESVAMTLKLAGETLDHNYKVDDNYIMIENEKLDSLDKTIVEFYYLCDQLSFNLETAIACLQQAQSTANYLPVKVIPSSLENPLHESVLSYPQYLLTVRLQISYAREIHDTLVAAAQNLISD